jgi:hypothetical protein
MPELALNSTPTMSLSCEGQSWTSVCHAGLPLIGEPLNIGYSKTIALRCTAMSQSQFNPIAEEWRLVPGVDGVEVSSVGQVRLVGQKKVLRRYSCGIGYVAVTVKGKSVYVHNLVAAAFLGPRPAGHVVIHLDNDLTNNQAATLAYATRGEAQRRAYARGSRTSTQGEHHHGAVLTEDDVRKIRSEPWIKPSRFARQFGVSCECICAVRTRKTWTHLD